MPGLPAAWEERCLDRLNRRPFRIIAWDDGGPEGREFVAEYRNVARLALALVYVDVELATPGNTTLHLRGEAVADNPVRSLFRDIANKAVRAATARLVDDG